MSTMRAKAIRSIDPNSRFSIISNVINWETTPIPDADIDAKEAELQSEYDSQAYARTRAAAYPSVADFMEAYTEKEIGSDSTKWDAYVIAYNKVRTDNPKS